MSKTFDRGYGVNGRRGARVRAMGCMLAGNWSHRCSGDIQACGDLWNGCAEAHREAGELGTSERRAFITRYGRDPSVRAAEVKAQLDAEFGTEPCCRCGEVDGHAVTCPSVEGRAAAQARSEAW